MGDHILFTELKKILADLYVEPADAKRIAADAGLDLAQIPFDAKAINNWHNILAVAIRSGALDTVLETALGEYGRHQPLIIICETYRHFVAAGGQLDAPELLSLGSKIATDGGSYVAGNVTPGHDFIGRDQHIHGDYVRGDKYEIKKAPVEWPIFVNVPPKPDLFIGRDALMQKLVDRLLSGESPALSAEGLPGVGKTTMAVALAHHPAVLAHFKDGVLWGGLGKQTDAMQVLTRWAGELGRDVSDLVTTMERAQAVKNAIGQRALLLVIDDAWDLETGTLLRCGGANCCHLLTTRDQAIARAFAGKAQVETVPVLDDETAYQLLIQLAPEACAADPTTAQRLVKAAGGLPLTVELLGGYLAAPEHSIFPELSIAALTAMSVPHQRLQLAARRLGSPDDRKTTIQETITMSVEDLPAAARAAFYALGAFAPKPETFDRTAAETITHANAATLALLIARNLVEMAQDQRLALHQVLAEVAQMETAPETIEQHRSYYLGLVNEDREDWQRIEPVYGQIKWAWETAPDDQQLSAFQALSTYQYRQGLWVDLVSWLQRLLDLAQLQGRQAEEGRLHNSLGLIYTYQGRYAAALKMCEESLAIARKLGNRYDEGQTLNNLGNIYNKQGRWDDAIQMYEESLTIVRSLGDLDGEGQTLNNLGSVYGKRGQWDDAIQMFKASLAIKRLLGDRYGEGNALNNLGLIYANQGQWDDAIQMFKASLHIKRELGYRYGEGKTLNNLGSVYVKQGQWDDAIQMFKESLTLARALGDRAGISQSTMDLGVVYDRQGRWDEAIQMFEESLVLARALGDRAGEGNTLDHLGMVYAKQGRWDEAIQMFEESLTLARALGDRAGISQSTTHLGLVYDHQGRWDEAIQMFEESLVLARALGDRYGEGHIIGNLGMVYAKQGRWDDAIQMFEGSLTIFRSLGYTHGEGITLMNLGNVYNHQKEAQKAEDLWQEALAKLHPDSPIYKQLAEWLQQQESKSHRSSTS